MFTWTTASPSTVGQNRRPTWATAGSRGAGGGRHGRPRRRSAPSTTASPATAPTVMAPTTTQARVASAATEAAAPSPAIQSRFCTMGGSAGSAKRSQAWSAAAHNAVAQMTGM